ncbi:UNVERIFIED_ORG: hypothetical protein LHJ69_07275 [Shinella sp. XGS7]|nr:hypothetical protein [Shinella sp. XGS7]
MRADEAMRDQVEIYRPSEWARSLRQFVSHYKSSELAAEALSKEISLLWDVQSIEQIWVQLGLSFRAGNLILALSEALVSSPLTLQLVAAEGMQSLHPHVFEKRFPGKAFKSSSIRKENVEEMRQAVLQVGNSLGLSRKFLETLVSTGLSGAASIEAGLSQGQAKTAMNALRTAIQSEFQIENCAPILDPMLRKFRSISRQAESRERVIKLLTDKHEFPRAAVWRHLPNDLVRLRAIDKSWLEQVAPKRKFAPPPMDDPVSRTEWYRHKVTDALAKDPLVTRSALHARFSTAMAWLIANDENWLNETLPARKGGRPAKPSRLSGAPP